MYVDFIIFSFGRLMLPVFNLLLIFNISFALILYSLRSGVMVGLNEYVYSNPFLYSSIAFAEIKSFNVPKSLTLPSFLIKMSVNIEIESSIILPSIYLKKSNGNLKPVASNLKHLIYPLCKTRCKYRFFFYKFLRYSHQK